VNIDKRRLIGIVEKFSEKKIAVWGDFILDEYLYGTTRRISREAPVLILSYRNKEYSLGGAGNSVLNLKELGASPIPIGIIGKDEEGERIFQILKRKKIPTEYIFKEKNYLTPVKTRILAGEETTRKQQILRIDKEGKVPDEEGLKQKMWSSLKSLQNELNALLISDYNYFTVKKDLFDRILPEYKKAKVPVTLDSRFRLLEFKGVTTSTPNEPEVEWCLRKEIGGNQSLVEGAGMELLKKTRASSVLITRGSKGMILFVKNRPPYPIPICGSTDIVDVTGAGDTVISVFTLSLACGSSFEEAAHLSNFAGGIVVMKKGTATLTTKELKEAILS